MCPNPGEQFAHLSARFPKLYVAKHQDLKVSVLPNALVKGFKTFGIAHLQKYETWMGRDFLTSKSQKIILGFLCFS